MRERLSVPLTKTVWQSRVGIWSAPEPTTGCHLWMRSHNGRYGRLQFRGRLDYAHRVSYTLNVGEIAKGLVIDHLCRTPLCVNPDHLRVVTPRENVMASNSPTKLNAMKTVCPSGHPLDGGNILWEGRKRKCRMCHNARRRVARPREG